MITGTPSYIPESLVGRTLGKYKVTEIIGRGGMGVVFKVWDTLEDKVKAIKMVPPEVASSPLAFEDLKREISMASGIVHPNVVKVLSLETQEGQYFIVMEYIEGESLEKKIADTEERKLPEYKVVDLMIKTAKGLKEAHARNVIHRDLKPRNIMETNEGQVKILDFGISHRMSRSLTELTGKDFTGTWPYMAPEQISNRFGRESQQVDIWALGITMYQLLSGEVPYRNRDQIIDIKEKPFPIPGISRKTNHVMLKCMEKDRKKRYQEMSDVLKDLQQIKISPGRKKEGLQEEEKKNQKPILEWPRAAAVLLVAAAILFLYYSLDLNRPSSNKLEAQSIGSEIKSNIPQARQEYENLIKKAKEAADGGYYTTALSHLEQARKINASPRLNALIQVFSARSKSLQIQSDAQQLIQLIKSNASQGEKIKQCLAFLQKYKNVSAYLHKEKDAEILNAISQIQDYLEQLQMKQIAFNDLADDLIRQYQHQIRRIEISGLPTGVRALGQVNFKLLVSPKGKIMVQNIDDSRLTITDPNQMTTVKLMMVNKLNSLFLTPPRDKNGVSAKLTGWNVTFKAGTFQDKIILLYEVQHA